MKRTFKFDPIPASMDVYSQGVKVRDAHNCRGGTVAFNAPEDFEFELRPHDPRVSVVAGVTPEGLKAVVDQAALEELVQEELKKLEAKLRGEAQAKADAKLKALTEPKRAPVGTTVR